MRAFLIDNLWLLIVLLILLLGAAFFSGSETALFSLSRHDRLHLKKSGKRAERLAASLIDRSRPLLIAVLLCNMTCNILIFVLSTLLLEQVHHDFGGYVMAALTVAPVLLVTYFGEVFPKILGRVYNRRLAPLVAPVLALLMRLFAPLSTAISSGIIKPVHRLVGPRQGRATLSSDELRELLEMAEHQGVIDVSENELLQEVVQLSEIHVRDVMVPRVDIVAFDLEDPPGKLRELIQKSHLTKLPVFEGQMDHLLGVIYAKAVLLEETAAAGAEDLRKLIRPVQFVPESQTLDRLLNQFRQTKTQLAIVVDEYGGVAGLVSLEDVVEQIIGEITTAQESPINLVQKVGPDEFIVAGNLSVLEWSEAFGMRVESTRSSTVAGLLASQLKRLPQVGDQARFGPIVMTVESLRGRRVERVRLRILETLAADDPKKAKSGAPSAAHASAAPSMVDAPTAPPRQAPSLGGPWHTGLAALSWALAPWWILAAAGLIGSMLFSGLETGIYGLSRLRLRVRTHHHDPAAMRLARWMDRPTYVLEGLLIWQNISNFAFSAAVTSILAGYGFGEWKQALISTVVVTPIVLIVAEIVPKDLFYTHTNRWTYKLVGVLTWCFRLITVIPLLPVIALMGRLSLRIIGGGKSEREILGPRQEMMNLVEESTATGVLTGTQQDLMQRALRMARITTRDVMIPWNRVIGVPASISRDGFRALVRHYNVSRMPVLGRSATDVLGIIEVLDVLGAGPTFHVRDHVHPAMTLIGEQSVRSAITLMQRARHTIAVVMDRQGHAVGLVTIKDLVEELVGDLENW